MSFTRRPRALILSAAILIVASSLSGAALARDITVTHAQGETTLRQSPRKVAVYDLATLDILNALGVDAIAGVPKNADGAGNFPPHLTKYGGARYKGVGTLFEPDEAALAALKPDLIVIGGRSAKKYDALAKIAPTIDMSTKGNDLAASAVANTRKLGEIFGVQNRAERKIAEFEATLAQLRAEAKTAGTAVLLFAAGQGVSVHAPGARFGHVYDFIGIRPAVAPVAAAEKTERPAAGSPEAEAALKARQAEVAAAMAADPTWILVLDRSAATGNTPSTIAEQLAADERIASTKAWKANRVVYLDPKTWYLVGAGIDALSDSAKATLLALKDCPYPHYLSALDTAAQAAPRGF